LKLTRAKRWILLGTAGISLALVVWLVVSLRNDDSTLSVIARYVEVRMCWSADSSVYCAIKTMAKYERNGRYDEAVRIGVAWAEKYPDSFISGSIYEDISALYLRRARMDAGHAEEYLNQAVFYRDKALRFASDSPHLLQTLVVISESVGDLSKAQRCVQYDNSIKFLNRMNLLANDEKDRLARQVKPDLAERRRVAYLSDWTDATIKRVHAKLSASVCQENQQSPG
jgi:hypothetical protein